MTDNTARPLVPHRMYEGTPNDGVRGIEIGGWVIERRKQPISDSETIDRYEQKLGFPVPEMIFGSNYLCVRHPASGLELKWGAWDALAQVQKDLPADQWLKVAYAREWTTYSAHKLHHAQTPVKKYDWTYSTTYPGTLTVPSSAQFEPSLKGIDYEKLKVPEPILFFDDIVLYEDELADNGAALLNIKVRVMPSGFFVLQRFFLRVDGVLCRIFDTRVYHEFAQPELVRERFTNERPYNEIVQQLPAAGKGDDQASKSLLADPAWVANVLSTLPTCQTPTSTLPHQQQFTPGATVDRLSLVHVSHQSA
ncbi:Tap42 interacting protein [Dimargaris verticillata]|uniref:Tap42 interacting protein n=1 Tax=Dimargaris verticillata TaxID=2761393 RepID=A0A9W8AZZ6_9FUNG|nr:Tap42 interacting protein [Dimargaris verticillata]